MTSFRQIEANRRNALKSTGPNTEEGKHRSRRNAVRHGLCAETVIAIVEDVDDYCGFEAAVIADYDARTAVERELVLRLASLLWRLRRATAIETDLLTIQAEILRDRQHRCETPDELDQPQNIFDDSRHVNSSPRRQKGYGERDNCDRDPCPPSHPVTALRQLTHCYQRLTNLDNGTFDRLGRYEAALWRQMLQTVFALQSARRRHDR
jgi:hypothetical protein